MTPNVVTDHANITADSDIPIARDSRVHFLRAENAAAEHPLLPEMAAMYMSGKSLANIGDRFGLTRERIRQILAAGNVDRRDPGAYQRVIREAWLEANTDAVLASWEKHRDIGAVLADFSDAPSTWVRLVVGDRIKQARPRPRSNVRRRTDEEILAHVRAAAAGNDTLTQSKYREYRDTHPAAVTTATLVHRFGSWNGTMVAAGLTPRASTVERYKRRWNDNEVREWVTKYVHHCEAVGRRPSSAYYEQWQREHDGAPSLGLVRIRVGSWASLLADIR